VWGPIVTMRGKGVAGPVRKSVFRAVCVLGRSSKLFGSSAGVAARTPNLVKDFKPPPPEVGHLLSCWRRRRRRRRVMVMRMMMMTTTMRMSMRKEGMTVLTL
jgi:hypothetical protein